MEIQAKDELLEQISLAVEQVQKQFVQGENVIKDCQETFLLCQCVDNILHHGLKEGLISWAVEPTIWPLLEKITCSKDLEEIKMLRLKSDKEKCNAWIKMAVNENLLGSYIATINQDHSLLNNYYNEYAFLRDAVMADTVKSLLNYGIANFDFQISISEYDLPTQKDVMAKPDCHLGYDAFVKTKENGYDSPTTQPGLVFSPQETWRTKKRKIKRQAVKTVVIADQDDYDDETEGAKVDSSNIVEDISEDENFTRIHENDKLLQNANDTGKANMGKSSLTTINQSDVSTVADVRTDSFDTRGSSFNEHVTDTANDTKSQKLSSSVTKSNNADVDQSDAGNELSNQRTVFVSNHLDWYLSPETSSHAMKRNNELDSLGRMIERPSSRQEFHANDFLLDETEPQSISNADSNFSLGKEHIKNVLDVESTPKTKNCSTEPKKDDANFQESCKNSDSGENSGLQNSEKDRSRVPRFYIGPSGTTEEFSEISSNSIDDNPPSSLKSQRGLGNSRDGRNHDCTNEELSETRTLRDKNFSNSEKSETGLTRGTTRNKKHDDSSDQLSEISSSGQSYDYRVRKVENPEFVPSSYGSSSALSDMTDDDRDLNFVPGIHRLSSKTFSSSFERKSTADSSLSFDESGLPLFESSHYTEFSSSQLSDDGSSRFGDLSNDWDMFEDLLNVDEQHFSGPDNFAGLSTSEELEMAIEHYKKMIKVTQEKSQQRDDLVNKLVKLRLRLQQEKDGPPVENPQFRKILSHQFSKTEGSSGTKYFCDQCCKNIWSVWQPLFTCNDCGYHSHRKCLELIQRPCPNRNLSLVSYILDICPDTGLDAQQYRCAECRKEIAFSKEDVAEARICDYIGQYFCNNCHWNDQISIPARVLRNWDFTQHKVCRKTKQLLELMKTRPVLNIQKINPLLYQYVEELREVGKFREDILIMKKYFLTCREALDSKLLIQLQKRQHFVDSAHTYSFQDLIDVNNDVLLPEISKVHANFLAHIKVDCELCRARGFICEVCQDSSDVIFAFDPHTVKCKKCSAVFHKICFKPEDCPKCERKKKVAELT